MALQTAKLLLKYHANPYQENDQGLTPVDVCKNPEILSMLKEEMGDREGEGEGEEDVFAPKEKGAKIRNSHLKTGSKGSSRSSVESLYDDEFPRDAVAEEEEESSYTRGEKTTPEASRHHGGGGGGGGRQKLELGSTPKSRPRARGVLYSDLSSSESDGEHLVDPSGKSGVRKVRYHLAKMGEAKQKLLGKLEESESGEAEFGRHGIGGGGGSMRGVAGPQKENGERTGMYCVFE